MSGVKLVKNSALKWLDEVQKRSSDDMIRGWLNRKAYPEILKMQMRRWETQNNISGEGWEPWRPLNPKYAKSKLKRFADYPGGGRKMLIATGRLVDSMIGRSREHRKTVSARSLEVSSTVPYGKYIDQGTENMVDRDISSIGRKTLDDLADSLVRYLLSGV